MLPIAHFDLSEFFGVKQMPRFLTVLPLFFRRLQSHD